MIWKLFRGYWWRVFPESWDWKGLLNWHPLHLLSCLESLNGLECTGGWVLPLCNSLSSYDNWAGCWALGPSCVSLGQLLPPPIWLVTSVLLPLLTGPSRSLPMSADQLKLPDVPLNFPECRDCPGNICLIHFTKWSKHSQYSTWKG